ncbi:MAG: hypothetical protein II098_09640 [Treponema sp.]|nr:hypothetical protein [Treponema sp.]
MKLRKSILFFWLMSVFSFNRGFASGYPVFDAANWLAAIDRFYQGYDQVMNSIEMIEQNYQMIQQAYEQAKSWSFNSPDFNDGDLLHSIDIRDEIKDASSQINRQLNNIRKMRDAFLNENIIMNGHRYSFKDLAGLGDKDETFLDFAKDVAEANKNSFVSACEALCEDLSEEEEEAIWSKYGMAPQNVAMVNEINKKMMETALPMLAEASEKAQKIRQEAEEQQAKLENSIVKKVMNGNGQDITPAEAGQANVMLTQRLCVAIKDIGAQLRQVCTFAAWKYTTEQQTKKIEDSVKNKRLENDNQSSIPESFN